LGSSKGSADKSEIINKLKDKWCINLVKEV
jgi:hypothetical protein